ncbi:hypothetical protein B0T14DRAFT_584758 [Immersiella caudata]|uniref:Uncharacterized protein n=1 Tax=Immersiella caudata TaxID=314043 RepID=A0AA39WPQ3_9PEZI|nr:hypothetical protein B0T14DRAFT_584758 [Immersiella caudata]
MFPRVPPTARVALRHRKSAIFSILTTTLLYLLYIITTPPPLPLSVTLLPLNATPLAPHPRPQSFLLPPPLPSTPTFSPGVPSSNPPSLALVIAHTTSESPILWINDPLSPSDPNSQPISSLFTPHLYTTDSLSPQLHTPINKGRESLAYLTHIIDSYSSLEDITLFLHAHKSSWHDDAFGLDTPTAVGRMNLSRVVERGYVNLRCGWEPGCPEHLKVREGRGGLDWGKPEEGVVWDAWMELFGGAAPEVLSQPCCAQFAVTKERIRERGIEFYTGVWVSLTPFPLTPRLADRKDIWAGNAVHCPDEHECYCQGYGICFESDQKYRGYIDQKHRWHELNDQVLDFINDVANRFNAADVLALADRLDRGESLDDVVGGKVDDTGNDDSDEKQEGVTSGEGGSDQSSPDGRQAGQSGGQLSEPKDQQQSDGDSNQQKAAGQPNTEDDDPQASSKDGEEDHREHDPEQEDREKDGSPPEPTAGGENQVQDGGRDETRQGQDGHDTEEENKQETGQPNKPPDQQIIPPPDEDQHKESNPEHLLHVVEISRELRTLGAWLVEQEDLAKKGGKP